MHGRTTLLSEVLVDLLFRSGFQKYTDCLVN